MRKVALFSLSARRTLRALQRANQSLDDVVLVKDGLFQAGDEDRVDQRFQGSTVEWVGDAGLAIQALVAPNLP